MKNLVAAFPKRPMQVNIDGFLRFIAGLLFAVFISAAGVAISITVPYFSTADIKRDWEISKDYEIIEDARIQNGTCKVKKLVFNDCEFDIFYRNKDFTHMQRHYELSFLDISFGDYTVEAIRSKSNPDLVSTDLAINKLWNRIITTIAFTALGIIMILGGIFIFFRNIKQRRTIKEMSGQILKPVPVKITARNEVNGVENVIYSYDGFGITKLFTTVIRKKEEAPFYANTIEGDTTALGVIVEGGNYVLLVDENLQRLDLTDSERQALRQARLQDSAQH